ncbi:hypothetical protein R1flu_003983 [Riccia fluitans]|uniref:RNA helicase n=1 Tax=Riccia fluitans TaxID=41844 RepID=A0ABD1YPZ0_9MARC
MGLAALPIHAYEAQILETVSQNAVSVLIGETGSGKTTQLSQMLHRAGYTSTGRIGVTQPRRVAAVSVARRVAFEMGGQVGEDVGYSIRFEDRTSARTAIKYLTDGCLLRECLYDPELHQYSVIILDEAHERSLNTDVLFGLLRRLVGKRKPELKIVVTSATLDGEKMSDFFFKCPIIRVPGKLFPVQIFYSKERPVSYLEASVQTALDIHVREPPGDILLFMTGQDEIEKTLLKLEEEVRNLEEGSCMDVVILPLYGSLPPEMQARVFGKPPDDCRRIIVATNIAETSLTVDGVVYVIDPGLVKQRQYNPASGVDSLAVVPISRVQAIQRAGRAGRTRPGRCYRLYPEAAYEHELLAATVPEIQRSSLAGTVLHLKSLELPDINILDFDFLDPPSIESLEDALSQLYIVDALDKTGSITALGKKMAELPLEPALARALMAAEELGCLDQALTVAAMLSCENIFYQAPRQGKEKKRPREEGNLPDGRGLGDHIQYLQIYDAWEKHDFDLKWCEENGLQKRSMKLARDVRRQLSQVMKKKKDGEPEPRESRSRQILGSARALRQALCKGFGNRIAHRLPRHNGYRCIGHKSQLVQIHPSSCSLEADEEGLLPEWVLYHELISTTHPFIRHVCAVEGSWVEPFLTKIDNIDIRSLSGRKASAKQSADAKELPTEKTGSLQVGESASAARSTASVSAARERYLARKQSKLSNGGAGSWISTGFGTPRMIKTAFRSYLNWRLRKDGLR